jgi:hypothetical protein
VEKVEGQQINVDTDFLPIPTYRGVSMLRRNPSIRMSFVAALAVVFATLLVPHYTLAQDISQNAMAGNYSVTFQVRRRIQAFKGPGAMMLRDGGAKPEAVNGPMHPNRHMVVFLKKDGKPVERARVEIRYRMGSMGKWSKLPVVRMHPKGESLATTHFGNNVMLKPGDYQVLVKVDGKSAVFHFTL